MASTPKDVADLDLGRSNVEQYLESPKRKKRVYVLFLMDANVGKELIRSIETFFKTQHKSMHQVYIPKPSDIERFVSREVSMIIASDTYANLDTLMQEIKAFKTKKNKTSVPVLFLSKNPDQVINHYYKYLRMYNEVDKLVDIRSLRTEVMLNIIKGQLNQADRRRSKRFRADLPIVIKSLNENKDLSGQLVDISMHGARIKMHTEGRLFKEPEQLLLKLKTVGLLDPKDGEFMYLGCRVRRVYISGDEAGVSFENLADHQRYLLTKLITSLSKESLKLGRR